MRLIDADELIKVIEKAQFEGSGNIMSIINDTPTVEYTFEEVFQKTVCEQRLYCPERPKGEWIENNYGRIQCSICKGAAISTMTGCLVDRHLEQYKTKFCPWCGADMRKGNTENG